MLNCSECNAAAAVATRVDAASRNKWVKTATGMPDIGTGEASSYAYVPGQPFEEYAGEQIAEQVEDFFSLLAAWKPLGEFPSQRSGRTSPRFRLEFLIGGISRV
jgi:hypothetical protein